MKRRLPTILAILSLPAGLLGYGVGAFLVRAILPEAADGIVMLFVPVLVAGLFMAPCLVPFLDRKAKADLAAYRAAQEAAGAPATNQAAEAEGPPKR